MKLILLIILIITNYCYSETSIYITPQGNGECNHGNFFGFGYTLPIGHCISLGSRSLYLDYNSNNGVIQTNWYDQCNQTSIIEQHSYLIDSCESFSVPNHTDFLSVFTTIGESYIPPDESVVFQYFYEGDSLCNGVSYIKWASPNFIENYGQGNQRKFICKNGKPYLYVCNNSGCHNFYFQSGCNVDHSHPYPFYVFCGSTYHKDI